MQLTISGLTRYDYLSFLEEYEKTNPEMTPEIAEEYDAIKEKNNELAFGLYITIQVTSMALSALAIWLRNRKKKNKDKLVYYLETPDGYKVTIEKIDGNKKEGDNEEADNDGSEDIKDFKDMLENISKILEK